MFLTPAVSRAARSEASGGHQPGTGWRRLDQPVRLGSEGRVLHFTWQSTLRRVGEGVENTLTCHFICMLNGFGYWLPFDVAQQCDARLEQHFEFRRSHEDEQRIPRCHQFAALFRTEHLQFRLAARYGLYC